MNYWNRCQTPRCDGWKAAPDESPTPENLHKALDDGCHLLHILAPVRQLTFDEVTSVVYLENDRGKALPLRIAKLAAIVNSAARTPLCCFLQSNSGLTSRSEDTGLGRAQLVC